MRHISCGYSVRANAKPWKRRRPAVTATPSIWKQVRRSLYHRLCVLNQITNQPSQGSRAGKYRPRNNACWQCTSMFASIFELRIAPIPLPHRNTVLEERQHIPLLQGGLRHAAHAGGVAGCRAGNEWPHGLQRLPALPLHVALRRTVRALANETSRRILIILTVAPHCIWVSRAPSTITEHAMFTVAVLSSHCVALCLTLTHNTCNKRTFGRCRTGTWWSWRARCPAAQGR